MMNMTPDISRLVPNLHESRKFFVHRVQSLARSWHTHGTVVLQICGVSVVWSSLPDKKRESWVGRTLVCHREKHLGLCSF